MHLVVLGCWKYQLHAGEVIDFSKNLAQNELKKEIELKDRENERLKQMVG